MKRYLILACALMVLLGGCSRPEPVWETVDDEVVQPVSAAEAPMEIVFDVPEEAELLGGRTAGLCAIRTATMPSPCAPSRRQISTRRCMPCRAIRRKSCARCCTREKGRCSFGWYAPETDGGRLYHAEILSDRDYYYALIFDVREDAGTTYHSTEEQVFASFGLIS